MEKFFFLVITTIRSGFYLYNDYQIKIFCMLEKLAYVLTANCCMHAIVFEPTKLYNLFIDL